MTLPSYAVTFRDLPACPCLAAWLPVYEAELQRRGTLTGPLRIFQLIGGAAASAGTHSQGGAFDISDLVGEIDVRVARQMGADATWARTAAQGFTPHLHGVLTGCPHNGPARYQIDAVRAGFNGLGHLGRGGPDDGPRPLSGRTWRKGIAWARQLQEDDVAAEDVWQYQIKGADDRYASNVLAQVFDRTARIEAALTALAAALGPAVEAAVKEALAESVVAVDVNVNTKEPPS